MDKRHLTALTADRTCVTGSIVGQDPEGSTIKVIPLYCKKWSCDHCAKYKTAQWRRIIIDGKPDRFVTLTLRHAEHLSAHTQAQTIKKAFAELVKRIRSYWGSFEYLLVFELTKKGTPHIHVSARGPFIDKKWLSRQWQELTGSFIVGIRKIGTSNEVANYMSKYMGKALADVSVQLQGMRIIQRSNGYLLQPPDHDKTDDELNASIPLDWTFCSYTPAEIYARMRGAFGWKLDEEVEEYEICLRGPPDEDIVAKLIWPLLDRDY